MTRIAVADFFAAISSSVKALDTVGARLSRARRGKSRRVMSANDGLSADIVGDARRGSEGGAATRWSAGRCEATHGDGEFVTVTRLTDGFAFERDALGVCPLYGTRIVVHGEVVWLASCSAAELRRLAGGAMRIDRAALLRFLGTGAVAGRASTLFDGIIALERGKTWRLRGRAMMLDTITEPASMPSIATGGSPADRVEALREFLFATARGNDDDALGLAVSGGIDSSGLLGAIAHHRGVGVPAYTYSQGDLAPEFDEAQWARLATDATGASHRVLHVEADDIQALMAAAARDQDFPFASPVVIAQHALFQRAADDGVRVMLGGHGPDLLCGGADSHLALRLAGLLRRGRAPKAIAFFEGARRHIAGNAVRFLASASQQALAGRCPVEPRAVRDSWLAADWLASDRTEPARETLDFSHEEHPLHALIDRQLTRSLGASSLLYERGNATAAGIEVRQPYLRRSLWSLMQTCAGDELVSPRGQPKAVLRAALMGLVPPRILSRERRIGFAVPVRDWLLRNRSWVEARFSELRSLVAWNGPLVEDFWREVQVPGAPAWRASFRAWRWLSLLEWSRHHDCRFD